MALLHPESDLTLSLVAQGAGILQQLGAQSRPVSIDHLLEMHLKQDGRRTVSNFFAAIDLLYAVGAIDREGYKLKLSVQGNTGDGNA